MNDDTRAPLRAHNGTLHRGIEPLRGRERVEWARVALEEAVGRMVKNPEESVFRVAVISRYRELDTLRGHTEREVVTAAKVGRPPMVDTPLCPNCWRAVTTERQHWTGTEYMCEQRPTPHGG